jgi:hypothetical protein
MTEYFRITGLNNILFDQGATGPYRLSGGSPPTGMSTPLTPQEVLGWIPRLPLGIRSYVLEKGLSIITCQINIQGATDTLMEQYRHDLTETLEAAALYIETSGARGTEGILRYKMDNVAVGNDSYKTIFYGTVDELGGRDVLGPKVKEGFLQDMKLTLYCQPCWEPASTTNLVTDNIVYNHDDGDANHDNYIDILAANVLGDVDVPLRLKLDQQSVVLKNAVKFVYVARRTLGTPANFSHWLEAEAGGFFQWVAVADADRSGGNIRWDNGLNANGWVDWTVNANMGDQVGRFRVYASLWANDIVNSQFRLTHREGQYGKFQYFPWTKMGLASQWQLIYLGTINHPAVGSDADDFHLLVEYQKDAADIAKIDYITLLPDDESIVLYQGDTSILGHAIQDSNWLIHDATVDFPYAELEDNTTGDRVGWANVLGGPSLTLRPRVNNRLYFKFLYPGTTLSIAQDIIDNNGAPANRLFVTIDYMPQYISPLE